MVLPVAGMLSGHCGCRRGRDCPRPAKHPLIAGGVRSATADADQIHRWWARWPWAGVGIATGARARLAVVDLDPAHGATASLERLDPGHQPLPPTLSARTGGGWHRYYQAPACISNTAGRLGALDLPGVDLRGEGGYVVAAPSPHPSGARYAWVADPSPLAPLPSWIAAPPPPTPTPLGVDRTPSYARHALEAECDRVARAALGARNDTLNRAAFSLGTLVGAGALEEGTVVEALANAAIRAGLATRAPLPTDEITATIASGLAAGRSRPRAPSRSREPARRVLLRR